MPIPAMRRNDRQLSNAQTIAILERGNLGVLSTLDKENQPYGVPVNFVYHQGAIYFHCATEGYKLLNISHQPQVSFCVIEKSELIPETFSTDYVSAIVFGKAYIVDDQEKIEALQWLIQHLAGNEIKKGDGVLFYQSSTEPLAVVGYCEVVKEGYPDHTQFDSSTDHFDPKANPKSPTWFMVEIKLVKEFKKPVTLDEIKANPKLKNMKLIQRGQRLSIQPVTPADWDEILKMGS